MRNLIIITAFIWVAVISSADSSLSSAHAKNTAEMLETTVNEAPTAANYGAIPLHFEANVGQTDSQVKFLTRGSGYSLFLTTDEAVLALAKSTKKNRSLKSDFLRMKISGANPSAEISGENLLEGKTNYIAGNDPSEWKTDISNYDRVRYQNVYDGIDVVYYGNQNQLEYDFVVSPNTDLRSIALEFKGAKKFKIDASGDLVFKFSSCEIRQHKPIAYQEIDGTRREIAAHYAIQNPKSKIQNQKIGFEVAEYDHTKPLVIDPILSYSTYLGGGADTFGTSIAVDSSGSAYITGNTNALDFPLVNPFQSTITAPFATQGGFVTKLNAAGTAFVYSTYLGFPNTLPSSIKVDAAGDAFIAGFTASNQFPTTAGAYLRTFPGGRAGFITKLSPNGASLIYSTYIGSVTELNGIALDSSGNAYATGYTQGPTTYPTTPGAFKTSLGDGIQNVFVTKLNATGSALVYSTFVGASAPVAGAFPQDKANAITVDPTGNAYITGQTTSRNYPVTSGAFQNLPVSGRDAFVTKINASGTALIYSTYFGGTDGTSGTGIALDAAGNVYLTGDFAGTPLFPFTLNAFRNGAGERGGPQFGNSFLTKINPTGTALVYSTALGIGRNGMSAGGVAVDSTGSAYVIGGEGSGAAYSVNAVQPVSHNNDSYILKMNPVGTALTYSTYFGGSNGGSAGSAIALDTTGNAYITGYTTASDIPITSGAPQSTKPGSQSYTAFVAKIGIQTNDCPAIEINPQPLAPAVLNTSYVRQLAATGGTAPYIFSQAPGFGADNLPRGLTLAANGTISGTPTSPNFGTYLVTVQAIDSIGCIGIRTIQLVYAQKPPRLSDFYLNIVARRFIRIGSEYTFFVTYANRTATDATNVPLILRAPSDVSMHLKYIQPTRMFSSGGYHFIVLNVPRIPAMSDLKALPITVKVSNPNRPDPRFNVDVVIPKFGLPAPTPLPSQPTPDLLNQSLREADSKLSVNPNDGPGVLCIIYIAYDGLAGPPGCRCLFEPCPDEPFGPPAPFQPFDDNIFAEEFSATSSTVSTGTSTDPNDKSGSSGVGAPRFYNNDVALPYSVTFENEDTATLPAQDVVVTDQLDPNVFDLSTFGFDLITFGDKQVTPQNAAKQFTADVDLRPAKQAIVRVNGSFSSNTGLITWRFNTLDPVTGVPVEDPFAGFLPPNRTSPEGQGMMLFTVKAKAELPTGTQIKNKARIVFDSNAPIDTPEWLNTIDNAKPVSSVQPLPTSVSKNVVLNWSGTDVGSGVSTYTIYVSTDGGAYLPFATSTTQTSSDLTSLAAGHTYRFYSIARDKVGNEETTKTTAEAVTTINLVSVSGRALTSDGRGLRNATVLITDSNGIRRTTTTSSFGFYQFDNILIGGAYTIGVSSRLFRFSPLLLQVADTLANVDFVGLE